MREYLCIILALALLVSCKHSKNQATNSDTIKEIIHLTDTSRGELIRNLDSLIKSNSSPDDITVHARFVNQGKNKNGDSYITLKTKEGNLLVLTNPMPFRQEDIAKFKKEGNNITAKYRASDKTINLILADYEQ